MQYTPGNPTDFFLQSLSTEAPRDLAVETQMPTPALMEIEWSGFKQNFLLKSFPIEYAISIKLPVRQIIKLQARLLSYHCP